MPVDLITEGQKHFDTETSKLAYFICRNNRLIFGKEANWKKHDESCKVTCETSKFL